MAMVQQRFHAAVLFAAHKLSVTVDPSLIPESPSCPPETRVTMPYIDDGLVACTRAVAESFWANILLTFRVLNIKTSTTPAHICPPSRKITALGFFIDLDEGTMSIPEEKLAELVTWVEFISRRSEVTLSDIKKLLGRMLRVSMIVEVGRRFVNRLLTVLQGPTRPGGLAVPVTSEMKADLHWWRYTAPKLNTKCLLDPPVFDLSTQYMVDGRGKLGTGEPPAVGGLHFERKEFFSMEVPPSFSQAPIHVVEAVAFLVAARAWIKYLQRDSVCLAASDSMPVVDSVRGGRPRDSTLQAVVRLLWHLHAAHQVQLHLSYVQTKENKADLLSRLDQGEVMRLKGLGWRQITIPVADFSLEEL